MQTIQLYTMGSGLRPLGKSRQTVCNRKMYQIYLFKFKNYIYQLIYWHNLLQVRERYDRR